MYEDSISCVPCILSAIGAPSLDPINLLKLFTTPIITVWYISGNIDNDCKIYSRYTTLLYHVLLISGWIWRTKMNKEDPNIIVWKCCRVLNRKYTAYEKSFARVRLTFWQHYHELPTIPLMLILTLSFHIYARLQSTLFSSCKYLLYKKLKVETAMVLSSRIL